MKRLALNIAFLSFLGFGSAFYAQNTKESQSISSNKGVTDAKKIASEEKSKLPKPYDPKADAAKDIDLLIKKAKEENKNIILQAGGNWCIWCLRFNQFIQTTPELKEIVDHNFEYYHLNYSPDNKNEKIFAQYNNPGEKYGYPVFIILNSHGELIHIQPSDVLEEGKGYSIDKVKEFLLSWTPTA